MEGCDPLRQGQGPDPDPPLLPYTPRPPPPYSRAPAGAQAGTPPFPRAGVDAERAGGTARLPRTMDGFYDQQVPFMGPGVSLPCAPPPRPWGSPPPWGSPQPWGHPVLGGCHPPDPLSSFLLLKSCAEEGRGRPGSDRKRKFLETDLAHDSEGRQGWPGAAVPSLQPRALAAAPLSLLAFIALEIILQIMAVFLCGVRKSFTLFQSSSRISASSKRPG